MFRSLFDNPYSPHPFQLVSPLEPTVAQNTLIESDGTRLRVGRGHWNVGVRVRAAGVQVVVDRGVVGNPRIRVFKGIVSSRGERSGCVVSGDFIIAGVVRWVVIPLIALSLIPFVLLSFYAWPFAPFAALWVWILGTFFSPRLALKTPALIETATREWLVATLDGTASGGGARASTHSAS
jgi:hypothetical protein